MVLPEVIEDVVSEADSISVPNDTVIDELKKSDSGSFALSLYMLGFASYTGFK